MQPLPHAFRLAAAGYPVFPIAASKRPTCPHGFKDAATEPADIRRLWRDHPGPLLGVPTGKVTGLFVLDLDTTRHTAAVMAKPKPIPPPPALDHGRISESVARRKIEGIVGAVATGKPGQRNAIAYWGACRLAELVALRILGEGDAIALAITAAGQAGLPPREAAAIAASAFARGRA